MRIRHAGAKRRSGLGRGLAALAVLGLGLVGLASCEPKTTSTPATVAPQAAGRSTSPTPCECKCDCHGQSSREVQDLTRSASRKVAHRDPGCMQDLERIRALDPRTDADLGYVRGQCEMVAGHCQAGRARITALLREQQALGPDMARRNADAMAGMYCRTGDANDRDQLLGALYDLNDGAFMNRRDPAFCRARIDLARTLIPRVRPRDRDDQQIATAKDTVYVAGANCFARAGDCKGAWTAFEQLYPRRHLAAVPAAQRSQVLRSSFESIVSACKAP